MPEVPFLYLAALTRDVGDAGSSDQLNVTINVNGIDVADAEFVADHPDAQGYLQHAVAVVSFDSDSLTNSSVRIGNRGDDAWAPQHILLFGNTSRESVVPIAMETDLTKWLSSDPNEGALTLPLRLVGLGGSDILIHRLLLLVRTADEDDAETDSLIQLEVTINGQLHVSQVITDTPQDDLERGVSNWYYLPVQTPFREQDLFGGNGRIELEILGDDAWLPDSLYVFGLDTPDGRPTKLVPLVSKRVWGGLVLSRDPNEGSKRVTL
jgi:hypothetical protein